MRPHDLLLNRHPPRCGPDPRQACRHSPESSARRFCRPPHSRRQRAMHIAYPIPAVIATHTPTGEIPALLLELRRRTASPATAKKEHDRRRLRSLFGRAENMQVQLGIAHRLVHHPLRTFQLNRMFFGWATRPMATRIKLQIKNLLHAPTVPRSRLMANDLADEDGLWNTPRMSDPKTVLVTGSAGRGTGSGAGITGARPFRMGLRPRALARITGSNRGRPQRSRGAQDRAGRRRGARAFGRHAR